MADLGFPRSLRLRRSLDFQAVQRAGRRQTAPHLVVLCLKREGAARFGVSVSRKVGGAVVRNRVKRRLREAIRHHRHGIAGVDVVFIAKPSAAAATGSDLSASVKLVLSQVRGITPSRESP